MKYSSLLAARNATSPQRKLLQTEATLPGLRVTPLHRSASSSTPR